MKFVNAKINIGLQIVSRRADGYHDLQTLFYPVGLYAGLPDNPVRFCDLLDAAPLSPGSGPSDPENDISCVHLSGRAVDCLLEKNLVFRAAELFRKEEGSGWIPEIWLEKHLPDGAGMGGGSADASFTLKALAEIEKRVSGREIPDERLAELALRLGADCPFFIYNRPMYARGVGERLEDVSLNLGGWWILVVKPDIHISTREAFAGVVPRPAQVDLREMAGTDPSEWKDVVTNDFELSLFPAHQELPAIKEALYHSGAAYASMTGSGSALYGLFRSPEQARKIQELLPSLPTKASSYLLKA